jgi:hypothetical protein
LHPGDHAGVLDNGIISIVIGTITTNKTPFWFAFGSEWSASRPTIFRLQKAMKFTSEEVMNLRSYTATPAPLSRRRFIGGSDDRVILSGEEAALVRLWHEQNVQMKSQRSLGVITDDPRHTRGHAARSSTAQAEHLRGKYSRASSQRQRQIAAKLTTFMTGIRNFMKAYAILGQKLYTRFSKHTFNQGGRVLVSCVATNLDIRNRVSMKTGRLSQIPNRPIQRSTRHPDLCTCHRHETVPTSHVTKSQSMITTSPNQ